MTTMKLLAMTMAQLKKTYGEQFDSLPEQVKKFVILQTICELMAKNPYLKYCIGEMFYNELNEVI